MAVPLHLAERFSSELLQALRGNQLTRTGAGPGFEFGIPALDALLPDSGVLRGGVVELAVGEGVPATSLALSACRAVQQAHQRAGRVASWCAFVDPGGSLYAPGVVQLGVELDRLLVVRPSLEALPRTVQRLAKSSAFELIVVDALGVPGAESALSLGSWPRLVRRLALEVEGSQRSIVLVTDAKAPRALPLPVAQRIEFTRPALDRLVVRVAKDRRGHVTSTRSVVWTRPLAASSECAVERVIHATAG